MATLDTLTLDGWQLDYFTGMALGYAMLISNNGAGPAYRANRQQSAYEPSNNSHHDLMPVLLAMRSIMRGPDGKDDWMVRADGCFDFARADALPVAVCRALVLHTFGVSVSLPGADSCEDLF